MTFPMLERVYVAALTAAGIDAGTRIPVDVQDLPGFVRVTRGPGSDDTITDRALVDVEVFGPTQIVAWDLAEEVRTVVHAMKGRVIAGALIDTVVTRNAPTRRDYGPHVERYVASYETTARRVTPEISDPDPGAGQP